MLFQHAFSRRDPVFLSASAPRRPKKLTFQVFLLQLKSQISNHKPLMLTIPVETAVEREIVRAALEMGCSTRHKHVARHASHVTRHTSHITHHTSHITRHTSHVTRHTSHVTRHTSHVTRHSPQLSHAGDGFPRSRQLAAVCPQYAQSAHDNRNILALELTLNRG